METAAEAQDYGDALRLQQDLAAKVEEYFAAIEKKKQEYETARATAQDKTDSCMVSARDFIKLAADRTALSTAQKTMEDAAKAEDYTKTKELAVDLEKKADAYLAAAKKEQEEYDKKAAEITKKLDEASEATRADVAKAIANGLSGKNDEIKYMPTAVRNRLLEEMRRDGLTADEKNASKVLFSTEYLDPEFEKIDIKTRRAMIEKMKNDPEFKKARENWDTISEKERIAILQKAVDYQSEAAGMPTIEITTYKKDDPKDFGMYKRSEDKLYVNAHDSALKKGGFDEAIDTAVHENGHRQQATMIKNLEPPPDPPKIKPGDPLYNQARTFKLNDSLTGYYVSPPSSSYPAHEKGPEYFTQPKEHHSRATGRDVQDAGIGK
jgi:hypothetical protein